MTATTQRAYRDPLPEDVARFDASVAYDYTNGAWTIDGKYIRCGHPESMRCDCYGRIHHGETVPRELLSR